MDDTAESVILKCVNALELVSEECTSLGHLTDGRILARLLSDLKNEFIEHHDFAGLIPYMESLLREQFTGPDLVQFREAAAGNVVELTKLCLLLLHIAVLDKESLRNRLVNSQLLTVATQSKAKYLLEAIHKRGAGLSSRFLQILCTEKLDCTAIVQCHTPVSRSNSRSVLGSPVVYTNSPRSSNVSSPLRELIQSPPFRLRELLMDKKREVRKLQQRVNVMEEEKVETTQQLTLAQKIIDKLNTTIHKLESRVQDTLKDRDELNLQIKSGEEVTIRQMTHLERENKQLRRENTQLETDIQQIQSTNCELDSKNESLGKKLKLVSAERDRLTEELSNMIEAKILNQDIIESQESDLRDMKVELQDLQRCLEEQRPSSELDISYSVGSPMSTALLSPPSSSLCEETLAESVVDKMLQETRAQLAQLEETYKAVQEDLELTLQTRDQLHTQNESLSKENENLICEMQEVRESYSKVRDEHDRTSHLFKQCQTCVEELQNTLCAKEEEVNQTRAQMAECEAREATTAATLATETRSRADLQDQLSQLMVKAEQEMFTTMEQHKDQVDELTKNFSDAKNECESLSREKDNITIELDTLTQSSLAHRLELEGKMAELGETRGKLEEELRAKEERLSDLHYEREQLSAKLEAEIQASDALRQDVATGTRQLEETKESYERMLREDREEMNRLENEREALAMQFETKVQELEDIQRRFDETVCEEREKYVALKKNMATEIGSLTAEKSSLSKEVEEIKVTHNSLQVEMEKTRTTWHDEKANLENETRSKEEAQMKLITEKDSELKELRTQLPTLNQVIKEKEDQLSKLQNDMENKKQEYEEVLTEQKSSLTAHQHEIQKLLEKNKSSEASKSELREIINRLEGEAENINKELDNQRLKVEETLRTHTEDKQKWQEEAQEKETRFSSINQDLTEKVTKLSKENLSLLQNLKHKNYALSTAMTKLKEISVQFKTEKTNIMQELKAKQSDLNHVREAFEKLKEGYSSAEKSLTEELSNTTSMLKSQEKNNCEIKQEIETLKQDMSASNSEHLKLLNQAKEEAASITSERTVALKTIDEQKAKIQEGVEKQKQITEELSTARLSLAAAEKATNELSVTHERQIIEHKKTLEEKVKEQVKISEELKSARTTLEKIQKEKEEEERESQAKITKLKSVLTEKEEEMKSKLSQLKEQIESVELGRAASQEQVTAVTALVEQAEEKHKATLASLKEKAEKQHSDYTADITSLQDKVTLLEETKAAVAKDLQEKTTSMAALSEELTKAKETIADTKREHEKVLKSLEKAKTERKDMQEMMKQEGKEMQEMLERKRNEVQEKAEKEQKEVQERAEKERKEMQEMVEQERKEIQQKAEKEQKELQKRSEKEQKEMQETLDHERTSTAVVMQKQEDALTALQEQVQQAVQHHSQEKEALTARISEAESSNTSLKNQIKSRETEILRLGGELQTEREMITSLQENSEGLTAQIENGISVMNTEIDRKEKAHLEIKTELESRLEALKSDKDNEMEALSREKNQHIEQKDEAINSLKTEKESLIEAHRAEKASLQDRINEGQSTIANLEQKLKDLTQLMTQEKDGLNQELQGQLNKYHEVQESLKSQTTSLSQNLKEKENNITALEKTVRVKDEAMASLQEQVKTMQESHLEELKQIERDLQQAQTSLEAEQKVITDQRVALETLNARVKEEAEHREQVEIAQSAMSQRIDELVESVTERDEALRDLQVKGSEDADRHLAEIQTLENNTKEQDEKINKLEQTLADQETQHTHKLTDIERQIRSSFIYTTTGEEADTCDSEGSLDESDNAVIPRILKLVDRKCQIVQREVEKVRTQEAAMVGVAKEERKRVEELETLLKEREERELKRVSELESRMEEREAEEDRRASELEMRLKEREERESKRVSELEIRLQEREEEERQKVNKLKSQLKERGDHELERVNELESQLKERDEEEVRRMNELETRLKEREEEKSTKLNELKTQLKEREEEIKKMNDQKIQLRQRDEEVEKMSELETQLRLKEGEIKKLSKSETQDDVKQMSSQYQAQLAQVNDDLKKRDHELETLRAELSLAMGEAKQLSTTVHQLEAKLIDRDQQTTAAKEEVMRAERESDKSTRSLKEELDAVKDKYRSERSNIAERVKLSYKNEVEKLLSQLEDQDQVRKEKDLLAQKYELAKKKLAESMTTLDEVQTTNNQYEKQAAKYKEHVNKLEANLQKEREKQSDASKRLTEVEGRYQPLREKVKESEATIKRMGADKRTLEVQVMHAEAKLKEMQRLHERQSLGGPEMMSTRGGPRSRLLSDTQKVDLLLTRASTSSEGWDTDTDDSLRPLIPKTRQSTNARPSRTTAGIRRATSSEMMTRRPVERYPTKQRSESTIQGTRSLRSKPTSTTSTSNTTTASTKMLPPPSPALGTGTSASTSAAPRDRSPAPDSSFGRSVPRDMLFRCEDEDEQFSNKYLLDMKIGRCNPCNPLGDEQWKRLSELQRRNSLYPPHMRSAYPAELQFSAPDDFEDDKLREGCALEDRQLMDLTQATESMGLDSPAFNLRKRKSPSVSSTNSALSLESSTGSKRPKRLSTSYSRPGPPTPGRKSMGRADKENRRESILSDISLASWACRSRKARSPSLTSLTSSPGSRRGSGSRSLASESPRGQSSRTPSVVSKAPGLRGTPRSKKSTMKTPASLRKLLGRGKSPWRKLDTSTAEQEVTGKSAQPHRLINRFNKNNKASKK